MMNEIRRKRQILKVDHYDGQCIYSERELYYELGGYLGGGAAGVVYEAFCARTKRHVAIKILNPVGYKLLPSTLLSRCIVAVRGKPLAPSNAFPDHDDGDDHDHDVLSMGFPRSQANHYNTGNSGGNLTPGGSSSNRFSTTATRMQLENVWWLIHPSTKQAVAAYEDPRTGSLRELSLPQCIDVWGSELQVDDFHDDVDRKFAQLEDAYQEVHVKNQQLRIPKIPKKFIKFASTRRTIHREISNMSGLGFHENVLRLEEALELVQDSKCTTFLVLELAAGGELFDRIKLDCGTDEDTARRYFQQLISGVAFCHSSGVCHRDLKPENLLLADTEELSTLKIADFGLSAIFAMTEQGGGDPDGSTTTSSGGSGSSSGGGNAARVQAIRRLRSVVGSPHYVAPEVLMDAGQGYDGAKADAWSIGVIVYAMLAGNLPFGKDLLKCLRYEKFKKWCYNTKYSDEEPVDEVAFPTWFFPAQFSVEVKSLVTQLLYPDASMRLSVEEAQRHAWVLGERLPRRAIDSPVNDEHPEASPPSSSSLSSGSLLVNAPAAPPSVVVANAVDQETPPRWTSTQPQRLGNPAMSPGGFNNSASRLHHALHGRSPTASPLSLGGGSSGNTVPPSPQKTALLRAQLMTSSAYMPSLDETAPLPSGQTPINSPRAEPTTAAMTSTTSTLQFEMDQPSTHAGVANKTIDQDSDRECQRTPSLVNVSPQAASAEAIPVLDQPTVATSTQSRAPRRRMFTSPPLATSSLLERSSQYKHRRNSPPELFLSRFGKGFKFEAIRTAFDEIDLDQFQPLAINLATTPTHTSPQLAQLHQQRQQRQQQPQPQQQHSQFPADGPSRCRSASYSSQSVPNTPMAMATSTSTAPSSSSSTSATSSGSGSGSVGPPSFHADLVARSTRFITTLPAQLVLAKIDAILTTPTNATTTNKRVTVDWDKYQMEVRDGDVLTCTVQVFLFQRGVYLVEFRRGQVEIFQFKRFYEDLREKLSSSAELPTPNLSPRRSPNSPSDNDNHNANHNHDDHDDDALSPPSSTRPLPRKRNKSIGVHAELLR